MSLMYGYYDGKCLQINIQVLSPVNIKYAGVVVTSARKTSSSMKKGVMVVGTEMTIIPTFVSPWWKHKVVTN